MIAGAKLGDKKAPAEKNTDRGIIRGIWECLGECYWGLNKLMNFKATIICLRGAPSAD